MQQADLDFLSSVLRQHLDPTQNTAFIFGSRAKQAHQKFSDFDIGITGKKLTAEKLFAIEDELEKSNFPYTVDVVDFNDVSESFRNIAQQHIINLNLSKNHT